MWTENLKDGKKRVCERYIDPTTGKQKTKCEVIKKNTNQGYKNAVFNLNKKIENELNKETELKNISFYNVCDLFLNYKKKMVATTEIDTNEHKGHITEQRYQLLSYSIKKLKRIIEDFPISNLNILIYNKILEIEDFKYSNHLTLNEIINFAYKQEIIKSKVFITSPTPTKRKISDKFLEHYEIDELLKLDFNIVIKAVIHILLETGMRVGEFLALKKEDIKITEIDGISCYSIIINKTIIKITKKLQYNTKNKKSREIGINKNVYNNLIFLSNLSNNEMVTNLKYNQLLNELRKIKLSSNKNITPHIFRHTHTSILAELGFSIEQIANRLGDKTDTIVDIYLHIRKKGTESEIKKFNNVITI